MWTRRANRRHPPEVRLGTLAASRHPSRRCGDGSKDESCHDLGDHGFGESWENVHAGHDQCAGEAGRALPPWSSNGSNDRCRYALRGEGWRDRSNRSPGPIRGAGEHRRVDGRTVQTRIRERCHVDWWRLRVSPRTANLLIEYVGTTGFGTSGALDVGIGPWHRAVDEAQSTLNVDAARWNRLTPCTYWLGSSSSPTIWVMSVATSQSARTTRLGMLVPSAVVTPTTATAGHDDPRHRLPAVDLDASTGLRPSHERRRDCPGTADGYGKSVLLAEADQHPAEQSAAGCVRGQVGVERVPCEQQSGRFTVEVLFRQAPHRQQCQAGEVERPGESD